MSAEFKHNAKGMVSSPSSGRGTRGQLSFAVRVVVLVAVSCLGWPNVRKYWVTAGDMTQLFQGGEVVMGEGWPLMTNQLRQARFPAAETIPKEGTTAWADHWVLTKGAKNLDAAYAWLEYTAQPFTQKLLYDVTAYIVANPAAKSYMSPEQAASQRDIADYGSKVNFWQWSPRLEKYQEIWNEVKAAK